MCGSSHASEILSFEEIERFVRVVVAMGVNRVRITGGEPLMRRNCPPWSANSPASRASRIWR